MKTINIPKKHRQLLKLSDFLKGSPQHLSVYNSLSFFDGKQEIPDKLADYVKKNYSTWIKQARKEWTKDKSSPYKDVSKASPEEHCELCNHPIDNAYGVINRKTRAKLWIGSDCRDVMLSNIELQGKDDKDTPEQSERREKIIDNEKLSKIFDDDFIKKSEFILPISFSHRYESIKKRASNIVETYVKHSSLDVPQLDTLFSEFETLNSAVQRKIELCKLPANMPRLLLEKGKKIKTIENKISKNSGNVNTEIASLIQVKDFLQYYSNATNETLINLSLTPINNDSLSITYQINNKEYTFTYNSKVVIKALGYPVKEQVGKCLDIYISMKKSIVSVPPETSAKLQKLMDDELGKLHFQLTGLNEDDLRRYIGQKEKNIDIDDRLNISNETIAIFVSKHRFYADNNGNWFDFKDKYEEFHKDLLAENPDIVTINTLNKMKKYSLRDIQQMIYDEISLGTNFS